MEKLPTSMCAASSRLSFTLATFYSLQKIYEGMVDQYLWSFSFSEKLPCQIWYFGFNRVNGLWEALMHEQLISFFYQEYVALRNFKLSRKLLCQIWYQVFN